MQDKQKKTSDAGQEVERQRRRLSEKRASVQSSLSSPATTSISPSNTISTTSNGNQSEQERLSRTNADYDHIRNTTLMFFLDKLFLASTEGIEARSLHDLSCLFGTKDFTKEMRQIVGASRNGLRKFLQSYPSLFTIEGDKVYLSQLRQESALKTRDYNQEAVDYFKQKLIQFGNSLVPIKNLFGYRSQASQEVRHISGKNSREFKQFLMDHDDVFEILADEHVILKSTLKELELRGESQPRIQMSVSLEEPAMDPYLNKQFANLVEERLKKMLSKDNVQQGQSDDTDERHKNDRVTIEDLHAQILQDCNNELFLKMVDTVEDLKVFLRMHPKLFKRYKATNDDHKELVGLISEDELKKEIESQASYSSRLQLLHRQHSTLNTSDSSISNLNGKSGPTEVESDNQEAKSTTEPPSANNKTKLDEVSCDNPSATKAAKRDLDDQEHPSITSSSLRANAPPFVPSNQPKSLQFHSATTMDTSNTHQQLKSTNHMQTNNKAQQVYPKLTQRSASSLTNPSSRGSNGRQSTNFNIVDSRQTLKNYLIKANNSNTSNAIYAPNKLSNGHQETTTIQSDQAQTSLKQQQVFKSSTIKQPLSMQNLNSSDDLRARTVKIVQEASNIITRIMTTSKAVAFDCKGYNLGFTGQITLIQFGFLPKSSDTNIIDAANNQMIHQNKADKENNHRLPNGKIKPEVCIFDLITNPELAYCLKPLLESDSIVKIVHDVRNKSNALFVQFGIMLNNVFDTQVANLVVQQQETGKPAYKSRYISMSKLCEVYGDEDLLKYRELIKSKTRCSGGSSVSSSSNKIKDVNYWRFRPLNDSMIYEATLDVYCLIGGIYQNLKSKIKQEYEPLFDQLNVEGILARIKPDEIRNVKKERKIDLEVIELKRKLYSDATVSIVLTNREIRLLRHIDLTEEVRQKIQQCKKVAKKIERLDMKAAQLSQLNNDSFNDSGNYQPSNLASLSSTSLDSKRDDAQSNSTSKCQNEQDEQQLDRTDQMEFGMTSLMDSSVFDELKCKMIESSSLLESLEGDDDDDILSGEASFHHSDHSGHLEHGGSNHDCRCRCHKSSSDGDKEKTSLSASINSTSTSESKAVDMAIQCDLLS